MVVPPDRPPSPERPPRWIAVAAVLGFAIVLIGIGMFGQSTTVATSSTTKPLLLDVDDPVSSTGVAVDVPPPAGEIPGLSGRVVVVTGIGESDGYYRQVWLRVWDAGSGMMIPSDVARSAFGFAVDPAGEHLAFRAADGAVWIQDLAAPSGEVVIAGGVGPPPPAPAGRAAAPGGGGPGGAGGGVYSRGDQNPVRVVDLTSTGDGFRVPSGSGPFAWPTDVADTRLAETGIDEGASEAGWLP